MLKLYDPWESILNSLQQKEAVPELLYYASEIEQSMGFTDEELEAAIERAFKACKTLRISIDDNFKSIFRSDNVHEMIPDWKLSSLACYLLIINADPSNTNVAKVQLFFASKNFQETHLKF
jgi:hypothetical protein